MQQQLKYCLSWTGRVCLAARRVCYFFNLFLIVGRNVVNMSSKNKTNKVTSQIKKKRNVISLKTKIDIIRRYNNGEKAFIIASTMDLPPTTVRTIIKNSAEIRESATSAGAGSVETTTKKGQY